MKAERLLSALLLLQARGRMSARQLSRKLEVSVRTVHRDMEALGAAGVPVYALRGARGGWLLDEGWRTQVPGLDEAELRALLMAQPRVVGDARLAAAAERAIGKLTAALPAGLRERAASIRERLYVDTSAWHGSTEDLSALPVVQEAVSRDLALAIKYRSRGREAAWRDVEPLGMVAKGTTWYLVARTPAGLRTFRVPRIEEAKLLDRRVERPAGFDLAEYWSTATEEIQKGWSRYEATLRLPLKAAATLERWRHAVALPETALSSDGWVTRRFGFEDEEQALFIVLGHGSRVEVLDPQSLQERVAAELHAALGRRPRRRRLDTGPRKRS